MPKKRWLVGVVAAALLAFGGVFAYQGLSNSGEPTYAKVLFSGDSLSDGWYSSEKEKGFVSLLENNLASRGTTEPIHTHKHGYRVQDVAREFEIPVGVDLAIVELGTNDVRLKTSPTDFANAYAGYLDDIASSSSDAKFVCLGVFSKASKSATILDTVIKSTCQLHAGTFVETKDIYADPSMRGPRGTQTWIGKADLTHPNDRGHALIASRVLEAVANL